MSGFKFNVLLYLDETEHAFYASIYAAILMINMPNMYLTVVQLKETKYGSIGKKPNWPKSWPISPDTECFFDVFSIKKNDINYCVLYCNPNIPDTVDAILDYAIKNSMELLIIGSGEQRSLKDLILGGLGHTLRKMSPIPVLEVNKLTKDYLDSYQPKPRLKIIRNDFRQ